MLLLFIVTGFLIQTNAQTLNRFSIDVQAEKNLCCSDYYIEPTGDASGSSEYLAHITRNQKLSCANPVKTDKCGTIVATRNTHQFPAGSGGVHCIETETCLECISKFQILCGPGFTWDKSIQKCIWKIPFDIAQQYDMGTYVSGRHGEHSCIVLKSNGYPIIEDKNNHEKTDCSHGECYGAYYNKDAYGHSASMVGEEMFQELGITWGGQAANRPVGYTEPPTATYVAPAPTPPPTLPPNWAEQHTDADGNIKTMQEVLLGDFCCNRFFNDGEIGMPKEIFQEGVEFAPGPHNSLINQMIAEGVAAVGRRRLKAYDSVGELPTFEHFYFGGYEACGHAPPVDTECGRVVAGNGLSLAGHITSNSEFSHYLGGAHCGDGGSATTLCKKCLEANVIACASGYSWDESEKKCTPGGPCANFEHQCHVRPHDQLVSDPTPCLKVSGHFQSYTAGSDDVSDAMCGNATYKASRACVWDFSRNLCKAGVHFGFDDIFGPPAAFTQTCAPKKDFQSCEHTIWEETMTCQSEQQVAYPISCVSGLSSGTISCNAADRSIPPSHDTDDICTVLQHRQGELKPLSGGKKYDEKEIMAMLEPLCHWPKESDTHKFIEWFENLNTLEIVAFVFLMLPIVGTLLCTANAIFKWNTGCCKACCGKVGRRKYKRGLTVPMLKSTKPGASIVVGPDTEKSAV